MIQKISTTEEAKSFEDISDTWKIVARRRLRTVANEIHAVWDYTGTLSEAKQSNIFRRLAIPSGKRDVPHISCVTGREDNGTLCLYARIYPMHLRRPRDRMVHS